MTTPAKSRTKDKQNTALAAVQTPDAQKASEHGPLAATQRDPAALTTSSADREDMAHDQPRRRQDVAADETLAGPQRTETPDPRGHRRSKKRKIANTPSEQPDPGSSSHPVQPQAEHLAMGTPWIEPVEIEYRLHTTSHPKTPLAVVMIPYETFERLQRWWRAQGAQQIPMRQAPPTTEPWRPTRQWWRSQTMQRPASSSTEGRRPQQQQQQQDSEP